MVFMHIGLWFVGIVRFEQGNSLGNVCPFFDNSSAGVDLLSFVNCIIFIAG